jgi:hypothetical protein
VASPRAATESNHNQHKEMLIGDRVKSGAAFVYLVSFMPSFNKARVCHPDPETWIA